MTHVREGYSFPRLFFLLFGTRSLMVFLYYSPPSGKGTERFNITVGVL